MIVAVFLANGAMFGLIEVGVVALAREHGQAEASGLMLALWATGSVVSGTFYGAIHWRRNAQRRFQIGAAAMAVGCVLISLSTRELPLVTVSLIIAGLANAPTLIAGNTREPRVRRPGGRRAPGQLVLALRGSPIPTVRGDQRPARAEPRATTQRLG